MEQPQGRPPPEAMPDVVVVRSGAVFSFGRGEAGRLGHGNEQNQLLPQRVKALREQKAVAVAVKRAVGVTG